MASITRSRGGSYLLQFTEGRRRVSVRLGPMERGTAEEVRRRVVAILGARRAGAALDADTAAWLGRVDEQLHGRLAKAGLCPSRARRRLGAFLEGYRARRTDVTEGTGRTMTTFAGMLVRHFGADRELSSITENDADGWLVWLRTEGYAAATIGRAIVRARQFWRAAGREGLVSGNPFEVLRAPSQVNKARAYFVDRQTADLVLDSCPDWRWRLIFALSRFGGLRCPSEHARLKWDDILWDKDRIAVDSPKTGLRFVPLFPELREHLSVAWEASQEPVYVLGRLDPGVNLRRALQRILKRAGVRPWPRLFHNLRATRQTELTNAFPAHVVCTWLGNSELVAADHYLQTTEDHFRQAATDSPLPGAAKSAARTEGQPGSRLEP